MTAGRRRDHQRDELSQLCQAGSDLREGDVEPPDRKHCQADNRDGATDIAGAAIPGLRQQGLVPRQHDGGILAKGAAGRIHADFSTGDRRWRIRSVTTSMIDTATMIISRMALTSV